MSSSKFDFSPEQLAEMLTPRQRAALERAPELVEELKLIYRAGMIPVQSVIAALSEVWCLTESEYPEGTPGTYEQGRHEGVIAALRSIRSHLAAQLRKLPADAERQRRERYIADLEGTVSQVAGLVGAKTADAAIERVRQMCASFDAILALKPLPTATKEDLSLAIGEILRHAAHGKGTGSTK